LDYLSFRIVQDIQRQMDQDADSSRVPRERGGPRLIERLREAIRSRHYSRRTEKSYWYWIRWYVRFHGMRHPADMGGREVSKFLSFLATQRGVAASTQNQALSALLFLYKHVLGQELPWLDGVTRAKRPVRRPTVLSRAEVARLLAQLTGAKWLMASLLYGSGLRQIEVLTLRARGSIEARVASGAGSSCFPPACSPRNRRPGSFVATMFIRIRCTGR
jgi:site-specific recombinase XerC